MHPNNHLSEWIIFQSGLNTIPLIDLKCDERTWVGKYNLGWHKSEVSDVMSTVELLVSSGAIEICEDFLVLTVDGMTLWEQIARPNWPLSYEWFCDEAKVDCIDFQISVSAASVERVCGLVTSAMNEGLFGIIDPKSIKFEQRIDFRPLYWKTLSDGCRVVFNSLWTERIPAVAVKAANFTIDKRWYRLIGN